MDKSKAHVVPAEGIFKKARVIIAEDFMTLDQVVQQVQSLRVRFGGDAMFYHGSQEVDAILTYVAFPESPEEELG
jgi:hypothetical protein